MTCDLTNCAPAPGLLSQFAAWIQTPVGIVIGGIIVGIVIASAYGISEWYNSHALAVDVAETAGPFAYTAERRRRRKRHR